MFPAGVAYLGAPLPEIRGDEVEGATWAEFSIADRICRISYVLVMRWAKAFHHTLKSGWKGPTLIVIKAKPSHGEVGAPVTPKIRKSSRLLTIHPQSHGEICEMQQRHGESFCVVPLAVWWFGMGDKGVSRSDTRAQ